MRETVTTSHIKALLWFLLSVVYIAVVTNICEHGQNVECSHCFQILCNGLYKFPVLTYILRSQ
jgi:hypothetical protein